MEPLVIFRDSDHTYWSKGKQLQSVSGLFKKYIPEFDTDFISKRNVIKEQFPDEYEKIKNKIKAIDKNLWWENPILPSLFPDQELLEERAKIVVAKWKEKADASRARGTMFHVKQEKEDLEIGRVINEYNGTSFKVMDFDKTYENESICDNMYDLPDGYYPELLVFNLEHGLAGQEDRVFIKTIGNKRLIWCGDLKTDETIEETPTFFTKKLLKPLNHLYDMNSVVYSLKGSAYAWMLEKAGFVVGGISISSVKIDDDLEILSKTVHKLPYLKEEVEKIVKKRR